MTISQPIPTIVQQKLATFDDLQPEFEASFQCMLDLHGQKRYTCLSIADVVYYLHALWVCECKDRLLGVYKNIERHEGRRCLNLLLHWQEDGNAADVIAFLQRKLDMLPLAVITRQIHEARARQQDDGLLQRLTHGRTILLNRGINMLLAFDAIIALPEDEALQQVRAACQQYHHQPAQITQQLADLDSPLFAYMPHRVLAQRNMTVMNKLSVDIMTRGASAATAQRSWRATQPAEPLGPFAEHVVVGYQEMLSPFYNNLMDHRFIDRPERDDNKMVLDARVEGMRRRQARASTLGES